MRKKIISHSAPNTIPLDEWLDLEPLATIELSSEDPAHPIEDALTSTGQGFLAATPGIQTIRLVFDAPRKLRRIFLLFVEAAHERAQEFVLRWSSDGKIFQEIVRQQWNFNHHSTHQTEDYRVELQGALILELLINPNVQERPDEAKTMVSLAAMRLA
jgi:hypothetical protein